MAIPFQRRFLSETRYAVVAAAILFATGALAQPPSVEPFLGKPRAVPGTPPPPVAPQVDEPPVVGPKEPNSAPIVLPPEAPATPETLEFPVVGLKAAILAPSAMPEEESEVPETPILRLKALILPPAAATVIPSPRSSNPVLFQDPPPTLPSPREKNPATQPLPNGKKGAAGDSEDAMLGISFGEPTREALFRMETETQLRDRLKRENPNWRDIKVDFAEPAPKAFRAERGWAFHRARVEPNGVAYGRLWFEQTGPERYGQDLGPASTLIEIAWFNWDLALWPVRVMTPPWQCVETSFGRALPGDPQPRWDFGFPYRSWRELP